MSNETTITITGNLTADPELAFAPSGVAYARFTIAATPRRFDKTTGDYTDGETLFMRCTAWRQLAENVAESLHRGQRVIATGRLRQSTWETPEGDKRSSIDLDVDEVGPSLRWATAKVTKTTRTGPGATNPNDPWAKPPADHREPVPAAAGAPSRPAAGGDPWSRPAGDEPPF